LLIVAAGCGGGSTTIVRKTVTTKASTTASPTGDAARTFMMDLGNARSVAPAEFAFSADGAIVGEHLHWTNWGGPTATARGIVNERNVHTDDAGLGRQDEMIENQTAVLAKLESIERRLERIENGSS
jgi:hypothetical protein